MISKTPRCEKERERTVNGWEIAEQLEEELAEATRVIVWLRSGGNLFHYSRIDRPLTYAEVGEHLDSNPPLDWIIPVRENHTAVG